METTSLVNLLKEEGVTQTPNGLILTIHPSWIVEGEDRLSYTTLIRLIECCREYHWQNDITSKCGETLVDSTCKTLTANFIKAIPVESRISINYYVIEVRRKGYLLKFTVTNAEDQTLYAELEIVSIFYDPVKRTSIVPPYTLFEYLSGLTTIKEIKKD